MLVRFKISRFDPEKDTEPRFQAFELELEGHQKILDALLAASSQEPSLSFRRSCRSAICGSCAVSVNGRPALACHMLISDAAAQGSPVVIEPLPGLRQLKDLVVDLEPFFESLRAVVPWVVSNEGQAAALTQAQSALVQRPATCILCGACETALPAGTETRPAALVKGCRLALDPRDRLGAARMALMNVPDAVLRLFVKDLPSVCPKGVDIPAEILELSA